MKFELITHKMIDAVNSDGEKALLIGKDDVFIKLLPQKTKDQFGVGLFKKLAEAGYKINIDVKLEFLFKENGIDVEMEIIK